MDINDMPVLRPVPIMTKGLSFWKRIYRWAVSKREWRLEEDWFYTLDEKRKILITKGFSFDGASVPRIFWTFISPVGLFLIPALIHDYAYYFNKLICIEDGKEISDMKEIGKIKYDNLFVKITNDVNGISFIGYVAWLFLFIGGWWAWYRHRKKDKVNEQNLIPFMKAETC